MSPQGLKPYVELIGFIGTSEEAAEKIEVLYEMREGAYLRG